MARIDLDLAHAYRPNPQADEDYALLPLAMSFDDGGAYALLGPSGCGKTTMLNLISGLLQPSQGTVRFDGADVTARTPQQRNIAQVFQFPVIYDTMTVAENLAFPLKNRGMGADRIKARVGKVAEMLELSGQLGQRAANLAADAKQKISLGRGLVREDVSAVLFDEPLTVIDPHLKWQLRRKLKQIHRELKLTLIYVTHDQVEALTLGDRIAVMNDGRLEQVGTPEEVYERPSSHWVAEFLGDADVLPGTASDGFAECELGRFAVAGELSGAVRLVIRPESVAIGHRAARDADASALVVGRSFYGHDQLVELELASGRRLRSRRLGFPAWHAGDRVRVWIDGPVTALAADQPAGATAR
jgi:glycerol transport system ATP-binding protein